jgi:glycosyltransferase involved in cell wall biosynthesis
MSYSPETDVTVLIAARNAEATIQRAIRSVRAQSSCPIVLVDDFSDDGTVNQAKLESPSNLTVVRPPYHGALGFTRQCGLNVIQTPLTLLLDADDAFLPGRVIRFAHQMHEQSVDIWADELLLFDGFSNALIRHIAIPDFIASAPVPYRLFERNYLPGVGQVGYRTELAKAVRYDPELHGPEDIDLVLRMMLAGGRFTYDTQPGYAMYAYASSVSRDLVRQKQMYARCLSKFSAQTLESFLLEQRVSQAEIKLCFHIMLIHQNRYEEAFEQLQYFEALASNSHCIRNMNNNKDLEWRMKFYKGSLLIKLDRPEEAISQLNQAAQLERRAEVVNNLGCAIRMLGHFSEASELFREALKKMPYYLDARNNLEDESKRELTLLEFRNFKVRDFY